MAKRFKQFDAKYAPRNHHKADEEGHPTPRGEYLTLTDDKLTAVLTRIDDKLARGQICADEAIYLRDYARRMRRDWGPWMDSTSVTYIVGGGVQEIRALQRRNAFVTALSTLKEFDDDERVA